MTESQWRLSRLSFAYGNKWCNGSNKRRAIRTYMHIIQILASSQKVHSTLV